MHKAESIKNDYPNLTVCRSSHAPNSDKHDDRNISSNVQGTKSLNDTHKDDLHMSLEGKLHETEAALNEVRFGYRTWKYTALSSRSTITFHS